MRARQGGKGEVRLAQKQIAWQPLAPEVKAVLGVAVSGDGRFAAASRANQVDVYRLGSQHRVARLVDPSLGDSLADRDLIQAVAFSPDGERIATSGFSAVRIWRRQAQTQRTAFAATSAAPLSMGVSGDGKIVAIGAADGVVQLYDVARGALLRSIKAHEAGASSVALGANGANLATGSSKGEVCVWNTADGSKIGGLATASPIGAIAFVQRDARIATGHADQQTRVWNLPLAEGAKPVLELAGLGGPVTSLDVTGEAKDQIFAGSSNGAVQQWDMASGAVRHHYASGAAVAALALRPDGKRLVTALQNGTARIWNTETGQPMADLLMDVAPARERDRDLMHVALARMRSTTAKAELDAAMALQTTAEANATKAIDAIANAEKELLDENATAEATLAAAKSNAVHAEESVGKVKETVARLSKQFEQLQGELQTAEAKSAELQTSHQAADAQPKPAIRSVGFTRDGQRIVVASADGQVRLFGGENGDSLDWSISSGNELAAMAVVDDATIVSVSPDRSVSLDRIAESWPLERVVGADNTSDRIGSTVTALSFSRDGQLLATGSGEASRSGVLKLWNVESGSRRIAEFPPSR